MRECVSVRVCLVGVCACGYLRWGEKFRVRRKDSHSFAVVLVVARLVRLWCRWLLELSELEPRAALFENRKWQGYLGRAKPHLRC